MYETNSREFEAFLALGTDAFACFRDTFLIAAAEEEGDGTTSSVDFFLLVVATLVVGDAVYFTHFRQSGLWFEEVFG